jgi:hypothetical protein
VCYKKAVLHFDEAPLCVCSYILLFPLGSEVDQCEVSGPVLIDFDLVTLTSRTFWCAVQITFYDGFLIGCYCYVFDRLLFVFACIFIYIEERDIEFITGAKEVFFKGGMAASGAIVLPDSCRILFLEKQTSKRENLSWSLRMATIIFVVKISGEMVALTVFMSGWNMPASARSYLKS